MDNELCVQHTRALQGMEKKIIEIEKEIHEIHGALMGTLKETGFISRTNARIYELESFKSAMTKFNWIMGTSIIGITLTLIVTVIVKVL